MVVIFPDQTIKDFLNINVLELWAICDEKVENLPNSAKTGR